MAVPLQADLLLQNPQVDVEYKLPSTSATGTCFFAPCCGSESKIYHSKFCVQEQYDSQITYIDESEPILTDGSKKRYGMYERIKQLVALITAFCYP